MFIIVCTQIQLYKLHSRAFTVNIYICTCMLYSHPEFQYFDHCVLYASITDL